MIRRIGIGLALLVVTGSLTAAGAAREQDAVEWRKWSPGIFNQAHREGRLILLDVTASWCATCQLMKRTTYRDRNVNEIIRRHYLPVRADFDGTPEIKARYAKYGVPATVIFTAKGEEIIRRSGYLAPEWMFWLLQAVADDPSPAAHR